MGEAEAQVRVLKDELDKSQKAVSKSKSKKAGEVERLMREKNSLQGKLQSQEDEFRLQNQTLLDELAKVRN